MYREQRFRRRLLVLYGHYFFENADDVYKYSRRGTCTLLSYRGKHACFFTRHQNAGYDPHAIRIIKGFFGGPSIASDALFNVNPENGEEFEDLCMLRVAKSTYGDGQMSDFFPLDDSEPPIDKAHIVVASGIPTTHSSIEYESAHIKAATVTLPCKYEQRVTWANRVHLLRLIRKNPASFSTFDLAVC
jgi:hypothetical protein